MTAATDFDVRLDAPLPDQLAAGPGTAVFCCGTAFPGRNLRLLVDGAEQELLAERMPRLDLFRAEHDDAAYASGWWGFARIGPTRAGDTVRLALRATLPDGTTADAPLGDLPVVALPDPVDAGTPEVVVCMATYEPPHALFERQVASLRAQTHEDWVCVISDDCSSAEGAATIARLVGDDPRFVVSRSPRRLGFYRNFERALALAPRGARYVALADQDDAWYPDKLATLVREIGDANLVYSDARVVDPAGDVRAETYWGDRRNNHEDLLSLLVANAVTGAASLLRRELLDDALPFPPAQFAHFHDHWLGLVARATGEVRYVDRPLYDYVQHGEATLGHAAATRMPTLRDRVGAFRRDPRERVRLWRMHYFVDVCRLRQVATVLELRCGDRMPPGQRRALRAFVDAEDSPRALAGLFARGARELLRRGRPETLGAEWMLAHGFAWKRLLDATARDTPQERLRLDAVPPAALDPKPGVSLPEDPGLRAMAEKIAPLRLAVRDDAPERVNLLIPTIDLAHFFGGYIAKLNLARRLARAGLRVRIVTVDPVGPLPRSWRRDLEGYAGLAGLFDEVEVAFGRDPAGLEVSTSDRWIATTWWSAHIAHAATGGAPFLYLIQEYEPFTFPMSTWAALAEQSYRFPHTALYSTELLREYFRRHGIGVHDDASSASFRNAITAVDPPTVAELRARESRRLLFYARPEPHAARNLFELGVLALGRAADAGVLRGWELRGIGTTALGRRLPVGGGAVLELLPRSGQDAYGALLREHDVGVSLMHTPHPSLVPLEMASAGMLTVTSSFEHKTPEALAAISSNLLTAEPTIEAVAAMIAEAVAGAGDAERRVAGARVDWARSWDEALPDDLVQRVVTLLP